MLQYNTNTNNTQAVIPVHFSNRATAAANCSRRACGNTAATRINPKAAMKMGAKAWV